MKLRNILRRVFIYCFLILFSFQIIACKKADSLSSEYSSDNLYSEEETIVTEEEVEEVNHKIVEVDYSKIFNGISGCAVFYDSESNIYYMYHKELCENQISPCSTFKIIATLMGLEKNVITNENSKMGYDGTEYQMEEWNRDLNLKDAFKTSCVWYFRRVIDGTQQENVKYYLDMLKYGNCDISEWSGNNVTSKPELKGFWLESSLKISPVEQVNVLTDIFNDETEFSKQNIEILKDIMKFQNNGNTTIYGKTGTGQNPETHKMDNGWYVGFCENSNNRYFFSIHLDDKNTEVSGAMAREIAVQIINEDYSDS